MRPCQLTKRSEIIIKLCTNFKLDIISIIFDVYDQLPEAHSVELAENHVRTHSDPEKKSAIKKEP